MLAIIKSLLVLGALYLVVLSTFAFTKEVNQATFNSNRSVKIPENYNHWIHVGSPLTPHELNKNGIAPFPEYHNVYIEPTAFDYYQAKGTWPEGTQIIKERTLVRAGDDCNKETGACKEVSGIGYFPGEFKGLELAVKDNKRFPNEPGGWTYFSFGNEGKPYAKTAKHFPTASCNTCHQNQAKGEFVFTQFYPLLQKNK